jgi:hypothetical protein
MLCRKEKFFEAINCLVEERDIMSMTWMKIMMRSLISSLPGDDMGQSGKITIHKFWDQKKQSETRIFKVQ